MRILKYAMRFGVAFALSLAAVGGANAQDKPFRIGAIFSKSGPYAEVGGVLEQALMTAVGIINANGGILNRKVEVSVRDDGSDPGRALLAARELVGNANIDVMYPNAISGAVLAILPFATESKIITISNAGAPAVGDATKFPYSFQYGDTANARGVGVAIAMKKAGARRIGIIANTNPATIATADEVKTQSEAMGMQIVGYEKFGAAVKDLTAQLQRLRAAGAEYVFLGGPAQDNLRVGMLGMQTLGWRAPVYVDLSTVANTNLMNDLPKSTHDQLRVLMARAAVRIDGKADPRIADFIKQLNSPKPLEIAALNTRDVVYLMKWAFETAQARMGNTSADSVRQVLEKAGKEPGYELKGVLIFEKPNYTETRHTTSEANYTDVWALMGVNAPVDSQYSGEAFRASLN